MVVELERVSMENNAGVEKPQTTKTDVTNWEQDKVLSRIETSAKQQERIHQLEQENRKRIQELRQVQKALSDAHTYVFEERERYLALQTEHDELKIQNQEDKQRMKQLLEVTQPVEQQVLYYEQAKPDTISFFPHKKYLNDKKENQIPENASCNTVGIQQDRQRRKSAGHTKHGESSSNAKERVMRTVYFPGTNIDSLSLKVESLQSQLNEQKQFYEERIAALQDDRRIRVEEEEVSRSALVRQLEEIQCQLRRKEELLRQSTRDYILEKRQRISLESDMKERENKLKQEKVSVEREYKERETKLQDTLRDVETGHEQFVSEHVEVYRKQIEDRESQLRKTEYSLEETRKQLTSKVDQYQHLYLQLRERFTSLEKRRALDIEGFHNDTCRLRQQLTAIERRVASLKLVLTVTDDDHLDKLLVYLRKQGQNIKQHKQRLGGKQHASTIRQEAFEIRDILEKVKAGLMERDQRLKVIKQSGQKE